MSVHNTSSVNVPVTPLPLGETSGAQAAAAQGTSARELSAQETMAMIASGASQTAADTSQSPQDLQRSMDRAAERMPVDMYTVMALVQRTAQAMRNANRQLRAEALDAQVGQLLQSANDMQKSANFKFAAAMVQSAMQVAGGGVQLGASISSGRDAAVAAKAQGLVDKANIKLSGMDKSTPEAQQLASHAQDWGTVSKSFQQSAEQTNARARVAGEFLGGTGGAIGAGLNFAASSAEVDAKRHEAAAKLHESATAEANDMMQQMMEVIRDVKDKLSAIDQSRTETNRGISRNI